MTCFSSRYTQNFDLFSISRIQDLFASEEGCMHEIIPNRARNRIYIRMDGFLKDEEVRQAIDQFIAEIKTMRPGFDVINDLTTFKPVSPQGTKEIERMIRYSNQHGVRHVMRVTGPNYIARLQFERLNKTAASSNLTEYVATREEAERRLDELNLTAIKAAA